MSDISKRDDKHLGRSRWISPLVVQPVRRECSRRSIAPRSASGGFSFSTLRSAGNSINPRRCAFKFLEVHESVESVADLSFVQRLIGHRTVDGLVDRFADADAQIAVAEAGVDGSAVIEGALPLRGTREARFPQGQHCWHGDYACRQNLSSLEKSHMANAKKTSRGSDPMIHALMSAPPDDEPTTAVEDAAAIEALADYHHGEGIPSDQLRAELDLGA
jgi:hypothetical protein